ncbi:MAG: thioester domain-containing protein [Clostridium sp.]|uniref:thioester domain-containing protein n=1 Tax=Clostridium sp. TaxID=1506 RepID=UPI0030742EDB
MKKKRIAGIFIIMALAVVIATGFKSFNKVDIPNKLIISIGNRNVGTVNYDNFSMTARKIISKAGLGYCLEIDKDYPSGEEFILKGDCTEAVKNILISGYPNKSAQELNLQSDDDAYFATQIAMWCVIEGYDVNKIQGHNKKVLDAIKNIYNNSMVSTRGKITYEAKEYYVNEETQNIVMLFKIEDIGGTPNPPIEEPSLPMEELIPPIKKPIAPEETLPQTGGVNKFITIIIGALFISMGSYFKLSTHK